MDLPILGVKELSIAIGASLIVGFGTGYYTKAQFDKADQLDAAIQARNNTAIGIKESLIVSADVENKATKSSAINDDIRKVVAAHLKGKTNETSQTNQEHSCNSNLDNWTVGMLDAARTGTVVNTTVISDDQSKATSNVTLQEFIDNDLAVVGLYKDLAIRHDTLVDYVNSLIQKQAK